MQGVECQKAKVSSSLFQAATSKMHIREREKTLESSRDFSFKHVDSQADQLILISWQHKSKGNLFDGFSVFCGSGNAFSSSHET